MTEEDHMEHRRMSPLVSAILTGVLVGLISGAIQGLGTVQVISTKLEYVQRDMNQKYSDLTNNVLRLAGKLEYVAEEQQRRTYYVYGKDGRVRKKGTIPGK